MINIGDKVSVLDDAIDGVVQKISGTQITIETTEGFTMNFQANELLVIQDDKLLDNIKRVNASQINKDKEEPKPRSFEKPKKTRQEVGVPEFDLHIEKLVPSTRGLNNFDILTIQTETAQRHIEFAIRNRIPKIVFIHGVGEGVLKAELDFLLNRYEQVSFQDANYQKYGQGATEVYFKQNVK